MALSLIWALFSDDSGNLLPQELRSITASRMKFTKSPINRVPTRVIGGKGGEGL